MPTVSYTPDQQAAIDKATAAIKTAEANVTAAQNNVNALYHVMDNAFGAGGLSPSDYNKPASLPAQLAIGRMDVHSCKRDPIFGTYMSANCPKDVAAFNQAYSNWQGASAAVSAANAALNTAKNNLTTLVSSFADINANDPALQQANAIAIANATAAQKKEQAKWILFGLITLVIVVAALIFAKMLLTHKTAI